jgi:hypothetical protein
MADSNYHVNAASDWSGRELAERQIEATLALAYEQRTANLIALLTAGYTAVEVNGVDYPKVADQIKERLGLE